MTPLDTKDLRKHNMNLIKDALKKTDYSTKNGLASETGLSIATCSNLLTLLIEANEVLEVSMAPSTGGRPSRQFKFNTNHKTLAQIILEKQTDKYFTIIQHTDLLGKPIDTEIIETHMIDSDLIIESLKKMLKKHSNLSTVAIGVPGVVGNDSIGICDIELLAHTNLISELNSKFDLNFILENDVNATALGFHLDTDTENFCYIYYPPHDGPGAGIIVNNQIIRGTRHFAGEVGFISSGLGTMENKLAAVITSMTCIIDPEIIILSGDNLNNTIIEKAKDLVKAAIPHDHLPKISLEETIKEHYLKGLTLISMTQ